MTARKKDFSTIATNPVYNTIAAATAETQEAQENTSTRAARRTYTEQEAAELKEAMNTTGRKGVKLPRINMAFSPSNYEYIVTMSRVRGENLTQFLNKLVNEHREAHQDIYDRALEFRKML